MGCEIMKKIVSLILAVITLCSVFCLAGCGEKTSITAEEFKTMMEAEGYTVVDATSQFAEYDHIVKVYLALSADQSHQIEFYETTSKETAQGMYNNNKATFEQSATGNYAQSNVSIANYGKYQLTVSGTYKVVSYINNTMIYINASSDCKDAIGAMLDKLGY